jgi:hypothetical protein
VLSCWLLLSLAVIVSVGKIVLFQLASLLLEKTSTQPQFHRYEIGKTGERLHVYLSTSKYSFCGLPFDKCSHVVHMVSISESIGFFLQGYIIDRRIGFTEKGPSGQNTTRSTQTSSTQTPRHQWYQRTHTDYSPNLHLSTWASSALKRPAAFHNSASPRIKCTTAIGEGVAPSNTMSFRCPADKSYTHPERKCLYNGVVAQGPSLVKLRCVRVTCQLCALLLWKISFSMQSCLRSID